MVSNVVRLDIGDLTLSNLLRDRLFLSTVIMDQHRIVQCLLFIPIFFPACQTTRAIESKIFTQIMTLQEANGKKTGAVAVLAH